MGYTVNQSRTRKMTIVSGKRSFPGEGLPDQFLDQSFGIVNKTTSYRSGRGYDNDTSDSLTNAQIASEYLGANAQSILYPYDTGHPFETNDATVKGRFNDSIFSYDQTSRGFRQRFDVKFSIATAIPSQEWFNIPSLDLVPIGTKAIAATNPIRPTASLAEFLAQMRSTQELPSIPGITKNAKYAFDFNLLMGNNLKDTIGRFLQIGGDSYLNLAFGWTPFIHDIIAISTAVLQSQKIVDQMLRDSGRQVRRAIRYPIQKTTTIILDNSPVWDNSLSIIGNGVMGGNQYSDNLLVTEGQISAVDSYSLEQWFSGAFTYKLADGDSVASRFLLYAQLAQKLVGLGITPKVLWDLAPWSWLADWFADIGDIFSNATDFGQDGLVLRYGYMMSKQTKTRTVIASGLHLQDGTPVGPFSTTWGASRKQRIRATPYGFGLNVAAFTPQQWAILASLGMTRGGNQLRNNDPSEPE